MYSDDRCRRLLDAIASLPLGDTRIMEVCGTHTMAIAEAGIRSLLPSHIHLLSGPGCPVCVTTPEDIDTALELAAERDVILAGYGDMIRVPGSHRGDSLQRRRAMGADVRVVYSPVDAVRMAEEHPNRQVVFLGVGFETTAPGTAAAVRIARSRGVQNFSVFSLLKSVEPALRALTEAEGFSVQGFLCPGHVATIVGERGFRFLADEYRIPGVIAGFEAEEILRAIYLLLRQIAEGRSEVQNAYPRAVRPEGNELAKKMLCECFCLEDARWRGLGEIPESGFALREELRAFDAEKKFDLKRRAAAPMNGCRCGDVITGKLSPQECPLFGGVCTPEDPLGPCMVSSEGACAAAYRYPELG